VSHPWVIFSKNDLEGVNGKVNSIARDKMSLVIIVVDIMTHFVRLGDNTNGSFCTTAVELTRESVYELDFVCNEKRVYGVFPYPFIRLSLLAS
jgi:hypothetical protein